MESKYARGRRRGSQSINANRFSHKIFSPHSRAEPGNLHAQALVGKVFYFLSTSPSFFYCCVSFANEIEEKGKFVLNHWNLHSALFILRYRNGMEEKSSRARSFYARYEEEIEMLLWLCCVLLNYKTRQRDREIQIDNRTANFGECLCVCVCMGMSPMGRGGGGGI